MLVVLAKIKKYLEDDRFVLNANGIVPMDTVERFGNELATILPDAFVRQLTPVMQRYLKVEISKLVVLVDPIFLKGMVPERLHAFLPIEPERERLRLG